MIYGPRRVPWYRRWLARWMLIARVESHATTLRMLAPSHNVFNSPWYARVVRLHRHQRERLQRLGVLR